MIQDVPACISRSQYGPVWFRWWRLIAGNKNCSDVILTLNIMGKEQP